MTAAAAPPEWVRDDPRATAGWEAAQLWREFDVAVIARRLAEVAEREPIPFHRGLVAGLAGVVADLVEETR